LKTSTGAIVMKTRDKPGADERARFAMFPRVCGGIVGSDMTPGARMILGMELDLVRCRQRDPGTRAHQHPSRFARDRFTWLPHRGAAPKDQD
jgi:hypothetical protein